MTIHGCYLETLFLCHRYPCTFCGHKFEQNILPTAVVNGSIAHRYTSPLAWYGYGWLSQGSMIDGAWDSGTNGNLWQNLNKCSALKRCMFHGFLLINCLFWQIVRKIKQRNKGAYVWDVLLWQLVCSVSSLVSQPIHSSCPDPSSREKKDLVTIESFLSGHWLHNDNCTTIITQR